MTMVIQAWRVAAQLTKATRVVNQAKRQEFQAVRRQLEEQLRESWEKRGMAECWRLARRLAGSRCGKTRRKLNVPQRCRPDVGEWRRALAAPEGAGGYSATFYDSREEMLMAIGRRAGAERHANASPAEVKAQMEQITKRVHNTKNRKTPPCGDVEVEYSTGTS